MRLHLAALAASGPLNEEPSATRRRLQERFPPGSARRMTQLGLLVGDALASLPASPATTLVYASAFGESRSLEAYLASFPSPSPTGFQVSIHPSGAQQGLIARRARYNEILPLAGGPSLGGALLLAAALAPGPAVAIAGGEEAGTWLADHGVASTSTFAFAALLNRSASRDDLAHLDLLPDDAAAGDGLDLPALLALLQAPAASTSVAAFPGWRLLVSPPTALP